jgi:hypothetical protein
MIFLMKTRDALLFFRALASNPRRVGAIAPSGSNLAGLATFEAMVLCAWRFGRGRQGPRRGRAPVEIVGGVR